MATQKFMGKGQLVPRLTEQLREQGVKDPDSAVRAILQKRGQMDAKGNLTPAGRRRDGMSAEERALDRHKRTTGKTGTYNPATNRVTRKK
jgi:hypothetical protein